MLLLLHRIKKHISFSVPLSLLFILVTSAGNAVICNIVRNDVTSHLLCTAITITALFYYLHRSGISNKISCLLIYFVIFLMVLVLQMVGIVITNLLFGSVEYTLYLGLISQSITLLLVLLVSWLAPISSLETFIEERNAIFSVVITSSVVLYYGITILWFVDVSNINTFILEIIVLVVLAITINTVILRESFVDRIYREKLSIYDTYFPIIDDMIEEIRTKQHDYHNQLQTLLAMKKDDLFTDKDIEDYITEVNRSNKWGELLKLDNKVISAFLYSKLVEIQNKCIDICLTIHDYDMPSLYSSYQLVEMYGILIDNAIEAVEAENSNGNIELYIYREDNMNIFEVRNTYRYISVAEINNFFINGYTTKSKGTRGIGLYKLKKMIEAKKGTIVFYYDTNLGKVIAKIIHY